MKILIIEDEKLLADSLKEMLMRKGFEVECVYDGISGTEYAELGVYDLLILDVMMPGMNGYQVARQVRNRRCSTPILITMYCVVSSLVSTLNSSIVFSPFLPIKIMHLHQESMQFHHHLR